MHAARSTGLLCLAAVLLLSGCRTAGPAPTPSPTPPFALAPYAPPTAWSVIYPTPTPLAAPATSPGEPLSELTIDLPILTPTSRSAIALPAVPEAGSASQASAASQAASLEFQGLNFAPGSPQIRIKILPPNESVNNGKQIVIAFTPGAPCEFGDRHACTAAYRTPSGGNVIFLTIHSGIGGEAEGYRRAVEGLGWDQAAYPLSEVQSKLRTLEGAQVIITQGDISRESLVLTAAGRVPGPQIKRYFAAPIANALARAAAADPNLQAVVDPTQTQIVFETCGWKMPEEPWSPGMSATTASVYLGVIR